MERVRFDFYVHGLWILASLFFLVASVVAGNLSYEEAASPASFVISLLIAFAIYLFATLLMISASVNAAKWER